MLHRKWLLSRYFYLYSVGALLIFGLCNASMLCNSGKNLTCKIFCMTAVMASVDVFQRNFFLILAEYFSFVFHLIFLCCAHFSSHLFSRHSVPHGCGRSWVFFSITLFHHLPSFLDLSFLVSYTFHVDGHSTRKLYCAYYGRTEKSLHIGSTRCLY